MAMAYAEADPYFGYGYAGAYGLGYAHLGLKSAPCVIAANVPVPCAAGYLHYGKRDAEAEAEAEPYYGYTGLGYAGLGYAGLGYAGLGYAGLRHAGLGYTGLGVHYGKREAEAEPKAEAEPYYGYAGLGYAGLGYTGLGYTGLHHYGKREAEAEPYY